MDSLLTDYSFIIFPIAKAYEDFLKQYLFDLGLISQKTYEGKRFRLGRALNPDIRDNQRDEFWLFDDVSSMCGEELSRSLWETWLECRNRVFHYFPAKNVKLSLTAVTTHLQLLDETISNAHQCKVDITAQDQNSMVEICLRGD
jgi:hypothetical protein